MTVCKYSELCPDGPSEKPFHGLMVVDGDCWVSFDGPFSNSWVQLGIWKKRDAVWTCGTHRQLHNGAEALWGLTNIDLPWKETPWKQIGFCCPSRKTVDCN